MRIGAIFARGSCRALKWMALFGVVFALGAGSAFAQVTITTPKTVDEAGRLTISVSAKIEVPVAHETAATLRVEATIDLREDSGDHDLTDAEKADGLTDAEAVDFDGTATHHVSLTVQPHQGTSTTNNKRTLTGTIVIQTRPDLDAEDEGLHLSYELSGIPDGVTAQGSAALAIVATGNNKKVKIVDTDDQTFEWKVATATPSESGDINLTLTADPEPEDRMHVTAVSVDLAGYTVDEPSHTFSMTAGTDTGDGPEATIVISPPNPDGDRDDDTLTVRAIRGGTNIDRATPLEIEVADIHGLPMADKVTAKAFMIDDMDKKTKEEAMSIMEGGDPVYVTVTVDRGEKGYPSGEALKVAVMADASQTLDYRVEPAEIAIASEVGKQSADFKLWALGDGDVGMEDLMLHLVASGATKDNGSGSVTGMFSIMIEDATTPLVSVKDDAYEAIMMALGDGPLNPGDEVMIMTDDLFMYDDKMVSVSFGASVDGAAVSASASGEAVTVMAMDAGEAKVTVTATATPMAQGLIITQDRANVAQLTFPVMVELADLMVTLSGPEDMNLVEGMSAMITATANRPVVGDTMVELIATEGTASPADYMAEPIMIMDGMMEGTTMLMAVEDDMMEDMEMVTLEGRVGGMKTNAVMFYIWDAAVPALPIIAQLLLGLFLALGGYRRYLRR